MLDGAATDTVVTQALGSRRFQVTIIGPGGHSWSDFGVPNPIVVLARAIARFSRTELPAEPKISANVGVISGGTSVNSIPESASMRVDIRSASPEEMERVERALREAVAEAASEYPKRARNGSKGIGCEIQLIGCRPAAELDPNARILHVIRAVDEHFGNRARPHASIPSSCGATRRCRPRKQAADVLGGAPQTRGSIMIPQPGNAAPQPEQFVQNFTVAEPRANPPPVYRAAPNRPCVRGAQGDAQTGPGFGDMRPVRSCRAGSRGGVQRAPGARSPGAYCGSRARCS